MENLRETHQLEKVSRLILFPLPLQGHLNPVLLLANILHARGFSITIILTDFNSPNPSNYSQFTFHSIPDSLSRTGSSTADVIALNSLLNINCVAPFRDCLSQLLSDPSEEPIACLITDAVWHSTQAVANGLKLPRIVLRTSSIPSFLAYAAMPLLQKSGYLPIKGAF